MSLLDRKAGMLELPLSDKEFRVLDEIADKKDMSRQGVMWCALRWLQLLEVTPGAYEAVQKLRPNLGPGGCMGDDDDVPPHNASGSANG